MSGEPLQPNLSKRDIACLNRDALYSEEDLFPYLPPEIRTKSMVRKLFPFGVRSRKCFLVSGQGVLDHLHPDPSLEPPANDRSGAHARTNA